MHQNDILKITEGCASLLRKKSSIIIAIDGRCGAGKTTLAGLLAAKLGCSVFHMDDFFLRPSQRTEQRLSAPGENIDHERFLSEALLPLSENKPFTYYPYNCRMQAFDKPVRAVPGRISVVEGVYSCHFALWDFYDLHVFADIDAKTQLARIIGRDGAEAAEAFKNKWIPLEEEYFSRFKIKERAEIII